MKAYIIQDDENSQVVFADSRQEAWEKRAWWFYGEENIEDEEFCTCERILEYDKYAETGFGIKEKLSEGWTLLCDECEREVGKYAYNNEDEVSRPQKPITQKDRVFCSKDCCNKWNKSRHKELKDRKEIERLMRNLGEGIKTLTVFTGTKSYACKCEDPSPGYATFKFPGGIHEVSGCPFCGWWSVIPADIIAFKEWAKSNKKMTESDVEIHDLAPRNEES